MEIEVQPIEQHLATRDVVVKFYSKNEVPSFFHEATRAVMGVTHYGNGAVSTWDKNGYRLATLN